MIRVLTILAAVAALAVSAAPVATAHREPDESGSMEVTSTKSVFLGVKAGPLKPSGGTAHRNSMLMRTVIEYDTGD
jgi:hypothetical protein